MIRNILASAGGAVEEKLDASDVFSTYLYTGNGTTQTINNGIDLAGKGGMVWIKSRTVARTHNLFDNSRTGLAYQVISTDTTTSQVDVDNRLTGLNTNGFSLGLSTAVNGTSENYGSWTFRKAPKFFDVVTYTGNGVAGRQIPHNLGCDVGMVIIKDTNNTADWMVYHKSTGTDGFMTLNTTAAFTPFANSWAISNTYFSPTYRNANGTTYVAYIFAHDPSADGIIQCGSFTTDVSGNATVNLGWEPQYVMTKKSLTTGNWVISDASRGAAVDFNSPVIYANTSAAEFNSSNAYRPNAAGFFAVSGGLSETSIYLAIRRPNKPPTSGTEVYNAIARTGTGAVATVSGVGFAPDMVVASGRTSGYDKSFLDKLRGRGVLSSTSSYQEVIPATGRDLISFGMDGVSVGIQASTPINAVASTINHFFKRAKGFFDNFCWTGTGVNRTIAHNLGVAPELLILKSRSAAGDWQVWFSGLASNEKLLLNSTAAKVTDTTLLNSTLPTSTLISLGTQAAVNTSSATYVGYAFANLPGIQSIGTYTGNGGTYNLNCGFSGGARFVILKAVTATGSFWVFDSVRGIVASTDFGLQLNSTAAEVTSADAVDPYSSGVSINQETTCNLNVNGVVYFYWAIS